MQYLEAYHSYQRRKRPAKFAFPPCIFIYLDAAHFINNMQQITDALQKRFITNWVMARASVHQGRNRLTRKCTVLYSNSFRILLAGQMSMLYDGCCLLHAFGILCRKIDTLFL